MGDQLLRLGVDVALGSGPDEAVSLHLLGEFVRRPWLDRQQTEDRVGGRCEFRELGTLVDKYSSKE